MTITVRALHPSLGGEIRGVDLRRPLSPEEFNEIHAAWMKHLVVVFPDQPVTDEQHVAFTRYFGEPEIFHQTIIRSRSIKEIFRLANVDEDGNIIPPAHTTMKQIALAQMWHTDSSYRSHPCIGSLLHGLEISRTGGVTQFINMYDVFDALPDSLKRQVEGRRALHDFGHLHKLADLKPQTEEEKAAVPPIWQPLVRIHPVTQRKSLYISPIYNDEVEGMDQTAARALIRDLTAFSEQERFMYRHQWEPDDILMWDNRCTIHAVTPHDPNERRVMHRTTIVGDEPVLAA